MQLIGYIDGIEVNFDFIPPDKFTAEIPKKMSGVYIVELHAIDAAGNTSSYSNIFIKIDFQNLKVEMLQLNYDHKNNNEENKFNELECEFRSLELKNPYTCNEILSFNYKELILQ